MYALPNKTQHKLIVKVRGGISQKLDNFTPSSPASTTTSTSLSQQTPAPAIGAGRNKNSFSSSPIILPQPIFHSVDQNGTRHQRLQSAHSKKSHNKHQYITPEHNEMINYVQQTWKGVERDYKKSVNSYINNLDLATSSSAKQAGGKKKTATTSTPLLLSGSYHHTSVARDSGNSRQDSFRPFDLDAFWGNRIFKRLTEEL